MEFIFFSSSGVGLFSRSDIESGHWVQEEMTVDAVFPFDSGKIIERGQRISFRDPATDSIEVFEIRKVKNIEPEHYQQITAEHVAISELTDEHINSTEITDKNPSQALSTVLTGTQWTVGNVSASNLSSCDIGRGSVWQAVNSIQQNWNVYITPRVVISGAGTITGRYLDITPAQGTFRGLRLSIDNAMSDSCVDYDDSEVLTALYGYGGNVNVPTTGYDTQVELNFANVEWSATADHPAKPTGQTYLEDPAKTAIYGRNGRPRYGYYQNADITDANVLLQKTWDALKKTSKPKICISGTCSDLYRFGYSGEPMRLHDIAIVEIRQTGEVFHKEIIKLDVDLVDPTANRPEIGDYIPNIIYINRETNQISSGRGGGGRRGQTNKEDEDSKYFTRFNKTSTMIGMVIGEKNGGYEINTGQICLAINESSGDSEAWINADHVNISATQTAHMLAGDLVYQDGKLVIKSANGLYVTRDGAQFGVFDNGNLTSGILVDKINGGTVKINAAHIELNGETVASSLEGESIACDTVGASQGVFGTVQGTDIYLELQEGVGTSIKSGIASATTTGGVLRLYDWRGELVATFSKAVASADWTWSNGSAKVHLSPQNQDFYSPAVDTWTVSGNPRPRGSIIDQDFNILDEDGATVKTMTFSVNASGAENTINMPTAQIYTTSGSPPGTHASTLESKVRQAIADGDHVVFRIDCGGSQKYYHMSF